MNEHFYDVSVQWQSDRKGILTSSVLPIGIEVATPPPFPKGINGIWSPEHLLVAAVNSCFMTTFLAIAENFKMEFKSFYSNAIGTLEKVEGKYMISEIVLHPKVTIFNPADQEKAMKVLQKSEAACLISNSVKSTVKMEPIVIFA